MKRYLLQFAALCVLGSATVAQTVELEPLDRALRRGSVALLDQQQDDGSFAPAGKRDLCRVALTAMALWGLAETRATPQSEPLDRAARYLIAQARDNGGIYDPARGLAVYTSGISARALRALGPRTDWPELASALNEAELFTYRRAQPESVVDSEQPGVERAGRSREIAQRLLPTAPADSPRARALAFLARCDADTLRLPSRVRIAIPQQQTAGATEFSYDDLLPFVYFELAPDQQVTQRAFAALRRYYTPERNPDLTKRYGEEGFGAGTQGLYYYYFVTAKALTTMGVAVLQTDDGQSHDWAAELSSRLLRLQRPDGSWANPDAQWWEAEPVLATSYALLTLHLCRARLEKDAARR